MPLKKINTVLAAAFILFILWFGTEYILSPETTAPGSTCRAGRPATATAS